MSLFINPWPLLESCVENKGLMPPKWVNRLVFWEPCVSPHKVSFILEVVKLLPSVEVVVCFDQGLPDDRRAMGWACDISLLPICYTSPDDSLVASICEQDPSGTLHILSGFRWLRLLESAVRGVRRVGGRFAIMSEPRDWRGLSGWLRFAHSLLTEQWFRSRSEFVLAIGSGGVKWFEATLYPKRKIVPFAYFLPKLNISPSGHAGIRRSGKVRVAFLGRVERSKGIFCLVKAMKGLSESHELYIGGVGSALFEVQRECEVSGVHCFAQGVLSLHDVPSFLNSVDVLVLPSIEKDGWGAVVSEALLNGTPVICSNYVGASWVLRGNRLLGRVVPAGDIAALRSALLEFSGNSDLLLARNSSLRMKWAENTISAKAGAVYLVHILNRICPD